MGWTHRHRYGLRGSTSRRATWITADPLNFKPRWDRLKLRRNFFTERVISEWKRILVDVKQKPTAASFKAAYAKHRETTTHPAAYETG